METVARSNFVAKVYDRRNNDEILDKTVRLKGQYHEMNNFFRRS